MTDTQRHPLFLTACESCGGRIRWVHDRPEPHTCPPFRDDTAATPWRIRNA